MSINAAYMRRAAQMGLTLEQAAELAEMIEAGFAQPVPTYAPSAAARRQKNYRNRKNGVTETITRDVTQDVTSDVTDPVTVTLPHVRGEDNLPRLVDTSSAVAVVAEAREPVSDWPDGDANQHAKLLAQLAGTSRLDPSRQPGLATTAGRLAAWKRDGASWTYDVVPAVTIMSQKRGPPIATWKYFDPAIAQSIADNRRALDIPPANGPRHERPNPPSAKFSAKQANLDRSFRAAQRVAARGALV